MGVSEAEALQAEGTAIAGVLRQQRLGNSKEPRDSVDWARFGRRGEGEGGRGHRK